MKIFIDSANLDELKDAISYGIIDGATTNPSLVSKENNQTKFKELVKEICEIVQGPVSAEVLSLESKDMIKEATELAKIDEHIVVKIPLTEDGIKATKILSDEGIKVNVTLVFSVSQAILVAKSGATYVSPFVGRLDDISSSGMNLIKDIVTVYNNYHNFNTEILVASTRHPQHIVSAGIMGADIVTLPYKVFKQLFKHPLSDIGLDNFLKDWKGK